MKRTILSGRKKTNDLGPLNQKTKAPTLFDHTTKIVPHILNLVIKAIQTQIINKRKEKKSPPTSHHHLLKLQYKYQFD